MGIWVSRWSKDDQKNLISMSKDTYSLVLTYLFETEESVILWIQNNPRFLDLLDANVSQSSIYISGYLRSVSRMKNFFVSSHKVGLVNASDGWSFIYEGQSEDWTYLRLERDRIPVPYLRLEGDRIPLHWEQKSVLGLFLDVYEFIQEQGKSSYVKKVFKDFFTKSGISVFMGKVYIAY